MGGRFSGSRWLVFGILFCLVGVAQEVRAEAPQKAVSAFEEYVAQVEARLSQQHKSSKGFLAGVEPGGKTDGRVRQGEVVIEQ